LATEAQPLVKVGGLGDVAGALPHALQALPAEISGGYEVDIRLVIPYHTPVKQKHPHAEFLFNFEVAASDGLVKASAYRLVVDGVQTYLIDGEPVARSHSVYSPDAAIDGPKYIFFSLAALELAKKLDWKPHILHANDWHTALLPHLIRERNEYKDLFSRTKTLLSVHNLPFMGGGSQAGLLEMGIKPSKDFRLPKWSKHMPLPMGLAASDRILAVSPGYAREMLTPEYGCGLDGFLFTVTEKLGGILNGLDTTLWDPSHDPLLVKNYSSYTIAKRAKNKEEILTRLGLEYEPRTPLIIMVTRIDQQKGIDIALKALESIMERKFQLIILGVGDPTLEDACKALEELYPERVRFLQRFDQTLSHQLYSSGDIILIPSRYEPCGLTQMISMRYGCVPVARNTGGLSDTIIDTSPDSGQTGFLFQETTPESCARAIERALNMFINQDIWLRIQKNGMKMDFSWKKSAEKMKEVFDKLM